MSDISREFPSSFELWEFVLSFEDGSLPPSAWNDRALATVAIWYLYLLPPSDAIERFEAGLKRNNLRYAYRAGALGDGASSTAEIWPIVMRRVLESFGDTNPLAAANRLMDADSPRPAHAKAA
ncbi:MAG TPA: hypothetical protein VM076_06815 [Gemmatimonadaceae bacterium]|nr:hypothetical protein [Gemmatimonadaceae bacterium]